MSTEPSVGVEHLPRHQQRDCRTLLSQEWLIDCETKFRIETINYAKTANGLTA
jgi:hypothetical protein